MFPQNTTLIVARYSDPLNWLPKVSGRIKIVVYNKGDDFTPMREAKVLRLPNVGNESHTYLSHIVENYDSMSGQLVFIQDHPAVHYHPYTDRFYDDLNRVSPKEKWVEFNIPYYKRRTCFPATHYWEKFFWQRCPKLVAAGIGTQFLTTAEALRTRRKGFWQSLLDASIHSPRMNHNENIMWFGYFLETFLPYIFSGEDFNTVERKQRKWLKQALVFPDDLKPFRVF